MNKPNIFYPLIIIALVLLTSINIYTYFQRKGTSTLELRAKDATIGEKDYLLSLERTNLNLALADDNKPLNPELVILTAEDQRLSLAQFREKYLKTPKIVLRYADVNCNSCVDSSLTALNRISTGIGKDNVLIFASYQNKRDLMVWKRVNHIKYPVFQIPSQTLGLGIENKDQPYLFALLPENLNVNHLFIPMKENTQRTDQYLGIFKSRYYAENN